MNIDIAIISENLIGVAYEDINQFINKCELKKVAITRGEKSILFFENGKIEEIHIESVEVKDTLGAGDVFHGAFCFFYLQKKDFKKALESASKVASESCKFFGTRAWMHQ